MQNLLAIIDAFQIAGTVLIHIFALLFMFYDVII